MPWDYLDVWFENFLNAVPLLQENAYVYVAYLEAPLFCLRFCRKGETLEIAEVKEEEARDPYHAETTIKASGKVLWSSEVPVADFLKELFRVERCYIEELGQWPGNEKLIRTLSDKLTIAETFASGLEAQLGPISF